MDWFSEFTKLSWFTVAMLAVALIAGVVALVRKDFAKRVMVTAGVLEAGLVAAILFYVNRFGPTGEAFRDIDMSLTAYSLSIVAIVIAMLAVMLISGRKDKWTARDVATAAMVVAMSFILSYIRIWEMPQGGSITPASLLPMIIYIVAFGPARGLVVGFAYGLLQLVQGAYVMHPAQLLLDFPMAFGALALGGLVNHTPLPRFAKLPAAILLGYLGRFVMHVLSGVIFFEAYAGEQNVWVYSTVYNISYLGFDALACMAVSLVPGFARVVDTLRKR